MRISERNLIRVFGAISWLIVLGHVLRLFFRWEILVEGRVIPIWMSWAGIGLFGYLGYSAIGWKLFWPISLLMEEVVGWWRAYWRSEAKGKLQYIMAGTLIITAAIYYWGASLQHRSVYLDTRPYVQLKFDGPHWKDSFEMSKKEGQVEIGGALIFHNHGKVPAVNVQTSVYIATDKDSGNRAPEFYRREGSRLSAVSSLESGGEDYVSGWSSLGAAIEFYYVDVVVSYEGVDRGRKYWSRLTKTFRIVDRKGDKDIVEAAGAADWDREQRRGVPNPSAPRFPVDLKKPQAASGT